MEEIETPAGTDAEMSVKTPSEMTDDELVAAARAGDESAFGRLFERHRRLVSRLGYRFFPRRDQVEEIIQESFIKAYFALDDIRAAARSRSSRGSPGSRCGPVTTNCGERGGAAKAASEI